MHVTVRKRLFIRSCYWFVIFILLLTFLSTGWAAAWSALGLRTLKTGEFSSAQSHFHKAALSLRPLAKIWGTIIPEFKLWNHGVAFAAETPDLITTVTAYLQAVAQGDVALATKHSQQLRTIIASQLIQLEQADPATRQTPFLSLVLPRDTEELLQQRSQLLKDFYTVAHELLAGQHKIVVLLQNSQEIRATGGFAGSFLYIELNNGVPVSLEVRDIYQPDGQFAGYVTPPPGVAEYLSGGKGWRLPDANWSPDFPISAKAISAYFAQGQYQGLDVIAAVNVSVIQEVLEIVGPIYLPDYQATLTAENFITLARADRDTFFPGSYQKPQFLQAVLNQLKFRLGTLNPEQQQRLAQAFRQAWGHKSIQLYFIDPELQQLAERQYLSGQLNVTGKHLCLTCTAKTKPPLFLQSVESNVGINKSNAELKREVAIDIHDQTLKMRLRFDNQALPNAKTDDRELTYINYQRLLLPTSAQITSIMNDNLKVDSWHEDIIQTEDGHQLKQVGWLVEVTPGKQVTVIVQAELPDLDLSTPALVIAQQSGIPETPYYLNWDGRELRWQMTSDTSISREMIQSFSHDLIPF